MKEGNRNLQDIEKEHKDPILSDEHTCFTQNMSPERVAEICQSRMVSPEVLRRFQIGFRERDGRYSIPVFDEKGQLRNIRFWLPPERRISGEGKIKSLRVGTGDNRLFPMQEIQSSDELLLVEGEWDALAAISAGVPAFTNTTGAKSFPKLKDLDVLRGKTITILMDNDAAGAKGARQRMEVLLDVAKEVRLSRYPADRSVGHDLVDEIRSCGADSLKTLIGGAAPVRPWEIGKTAVTQFSQIDSHIAEHRWAPYLPAEAITLVEGDPGIGKSYLVNAIVACLSKGVIPGAEGGVAFPPKKSLILNEEDSPGVIKERLEKLGTNLQRVAYLSFADSFESQTIEKLEDCLFEFRPDVLVVDPIISKLGRANPNNAAEVRGILRPLALIARYYGMAIIIVRHLNKNGQASLLQKGQGSMDFVGAARSVLHVARHPENPSHSVMMHTKANCSEKGKAIAFRIDNSGFHWLGQTEVSEEQLGQQLSVASERPQDELDAATSFLEAELRAGPVLSTDLFESAREALISDATLKRARQKLIKEKRLKFTRKGMPGKRGGGRVFWELQDGVSREPENQMSHKIVNSSSSMCEEIEPIEDLLAHVDGALVVRECEAD